jgi:hypothetical protein
MVEIMCEGRFSQFLIKPPHRRLRVPREAFVSDQDELPGILAELGLA